MSKFAVEFNVRGIRFLFVDDVWFELPETDGEKYLPTTDGIDASTVEHLTVQDHANRTHEEKRLLWHTATDLEKRMMENSIRKS